jgi:hypothetical protein
MCIEDQVQASSQDHLDHVAAHAIHPQMRTPLPSSILGLIDVVKCELRGQL